MALNLRSIDPDTFYDTQEASKLLCKSAAWFERHRWAGTGPTYSPGRPVRYLGRDLLAWLEAQRVPSKSQAAA